MLVHRHRLQPADVEDVLSQSILDFLSAALVDHPKNDGLFLVIARRRAVDFIRDRDRERTLYEDRRPSTSPDRTHLEKDLMARAIRRYASENKNLDEKRLLAVADQVFEGASFAEACRESGIPRGSQNRYRRTLGAFLDRLTRRH
jgi:DNA-directed RNA polymerase specialized sigma24 family protein